MNNEQWLDTFEIRENRYMGGVLLKPHVYCFNCDARHWEVWDSSFSATKSASDVLAQSWRPITLECTCGARCTILNGHICK